MTTSCRTHPVCTIYEHDVLVAEGGPLSKSAGSGEVPVPVFDWLQRQCLMQSADNRPRWARLGQRAGVLTVQVTNYVGVIRAPSGFQIEVLPKVGRVHGQADWARRLLVRMLACLGSFRHIKTARAELAATRMPLQEIFVAEFLESVSSIVKRGLRGLYTTQQDNLPFLRGKLVFSEHLRRNLVRRDSFFSEHSDFTTNRPENRLIHAALRQVIAQSVTHSNQQRALELRLVLSDVPVSTNVAADLRALQPERNTAHYAEALSWAELILTGRAPLTGAGGQSATSMLFPMEMLFEAYVAKHLSLAGDALLRLKVHPATHYLVEHEDERWFRLEPDLVVRRGARNLAVLDAKWKLLNASSSARKDRYNLSQGDFYQLHTYGQTYLAGEGDVILIYPKTETFHRPLKPFVFPHAPGLRLWVVPFCLDNKMLIQPEQEHSIPLFPPIF